MNLYNETNEQQRKFLKEADIIINKDKDYSKEETNRIYSMLTEYIFNKSKKDIPVEIGKFSEVLQIVKKY